MICLVKILDFVLYWVFFLNIVGCFGLVGKLFMYIELNRIFRILGLEVIIVEDG